MTHAVDAQVAAEFGVDGTGEKLTSLDRWLRLLVEMPAAAAVVAEVIILLVGIIARGVFQSPLIWSDELASIIFLWLAMLGAAIAVQRSAHMRLTFFVSFLSPRMEAFAATFAAGAVVLFLGIILYPAWAYMEDQSFVETPAPPRSRRGSPGRE